MQNALPLLVVVTTQEPVAKFMLALLLVTCTQNVLGTALGNISTKMNHKPFKSLACVCISNASIIVGLLRISIKCLHAP